MSPRSFLLALLSVAFWSCQSTGGPSSDRFSREDHRWMDALDDIALDHGYFRRPDYEPKDAPYSTVMTYTRMMNRHDSITYLLAQDRTTKRYTVIVWDLPTPRGWSPEARDIADVIGDRLGRANVRLTKAWMEHYPSNQAMQRTAGRSAFPL